jgi:hypothetical protein
VQVEVLELVVDGEVKGVPGAGQHLALAVDIEGMGLAQRQGGSGGMLFDGVEFLLDQVEHGVLRKAGILE